MYARRMRARAAVPRHFRLNPVDSRRAPRMDPRGTRELRPAAASRAEIRINARGPGDRGPFYDLPRDGLMPARWAGGSFVSPLRPSACNLVRTVAIRTASRLARDPMDREVYFEGLPSSHRANPRGRRRLVPISDCSRRLYRIRRHDRQNEFEPRPVLAV